LQDRDNQVPNPSVNVDSSGWVRTYGGGGTIASSRVSSGSTNFSTAYRISCSANMTDAALLTVGSASSGTYAIAVGSSAPVAISVYVRCSQAGKSGGVRANFYTAAGVLIGTSVSVAGWVATVANTWYRVGRAFTTPANAAFVTVDIDSAPLTSGNTWDCGGLLVENVAQFSTSAVSSSYFDGDTAPASGGATGWYGTTGASKSWLTYPDNLLTLAPDASSSTYSSFPEGMSAWQVTTALGYPVRGMMVVHRAEGGGVAPTDSGVCFQQLFPDTDASSTTTAKMLTRAYNDGIPGWTNWTSASIISDKAGNDLYVGASAPAYPRDGDLWVSPGAGGGVVGQVLGGLAEITANVTTTSATAVDAAGLTCSVTLSSTRRYRVKLTGSVSATVASARIGVAINDGASVVISGAVQATIPTNVGQLFSMERTIVGPTDGAHTFKVQFWIATGGGTVALNGSTSATVPQATQLTIEDVGAA